jgi:DNA-binding response OmpR family regulator
MDNAVQSNHRVLLIDDDPEFIKTIQDIFADEIELRVAMEAKAALCATRRWQPHLIILDALLSNADAFALLDEIRSARGGARYGVVYLAKGRGAHTHFHVLGNELFGVLQRGTDEGRLRRDLDNALALATHRTSERAA